MDYVEKAGRVIDLEISELQRLRQRLGESFGRAVDLIKSAVENRGKVIVLGVGKSGHIGEKIAATLTSTGSPAVVLNSLNALHGDLGVVADGDVVLALSYSGETEELLRILPAIARFQVAVIAMCSAAESTLAQNCDVFLDINVEQEACPLNLAPTASTSAMLAMGDALAMVVSQERRFSREDYALYHPAGALGRKLMKVREVMRKGEQMPIVATGTTIRDVVLVMNRTPGRPGAALVVNADRRLVGIFTHGDLARLLEHAGRIDVGDVVDAHMGRNPKVIQADQLVEEAQRLLREHRIDQIPVVDPDRRPLGLVDVQDLLDVRI